MAKAKKGAGAETAADAAELDPSKVESAPEPAKKPTDPRVAAKSVPAGTDPAKVRERLGEPEPVDGAKLDPKTGRVEAPAPGTFDPAKRKPQTA